MSDHAPPFTHQRLSGSSLAVRGLDRSLAFDWTAAVLGTWLLAGIYADGWAHNHIDVDSFWTPWHALLYTGFLANAIFLGTTVFRRHRSGQAWREAAPPGYAMSAIGVLLFMVSGVGDMTWHLILGIEKSVSAGFSPPHLGIMIATGLIVTGPFAAAWKRAESPSGWAEWMPVLISITLALSLMTFVTQYASPIVVILASTKPSHYADQSLGAVSILLQAAIITGWILITIRRWMLPIGSLILVLTVNVISMSLMRDHYFLITAIVVAAIAVDILYRWLAPSSARPVRFHAFAFLIPVLYFALYFAVVALHQGIFWPIPLWTGATFMAGIVSTLISFLILPAPYPGRPPA